METPDSSSIAKARLIRRQIGSLIDAILRRTALPLLTSRPFARVLRAPLGAAMVGEALEEYHQVIDFRLGQLERLEQALAVCVQPLRIELGVIAHHVTQSGELAVVHVRCGQCSVPQRRHAELAEVALLLRHMGRALSSAARGIVVVRPQQIEPAVLELPDALVAAGIDPAGRGKKRDADVVEFAVGEVRPEVTDIAGALAYE